MSPRACRITRIAIATTLAACSSAPAPVTPTPIAAEPAPAPPPMAAAAPAPVDAGVPDAVLAAPAWIFRYHTADRAETWVLRYADGQAVLEIDRGHGPMRYLGSATEGAALALDVTTGSARLTLSCKHATRPLGRTCNDTKAKPIDVLDCYHPDFAAPMPFGRAPGIEYVVDATCNGYRVIAP